MVKDIFIGGWLVIISAIILYVILKSIWSIINLVLYDKARKEWQKTEDKIKENKKGIK